MTDQIKTLFTSAEAPTNPIEPDKDAKPPEDGVALCLSGGGYRAMVFHLGALLRLNEAAILRKIKRISSVSGGSITAGVLGLNWKNLNFGDNGVAANFMGQVVDPIRKLASRTIDAGAIFSGVLFPGSIAEKITDAYDKLLFKGSTLQDLPSHDAPRFVINATSLQSGALWRFSQPYMADYLVGRVLKPKTPLAVAVAASSAFPPILSPVELELDPQDFETDPDCPLQHEPYTSSVVLTDGGVYDNLGLETAWKRYKTILVSDAGGKLASEDEPKSDWARQAYRVLNVIDNQVRSLRKRQLMASYKAPDDDLIHRTGAYWGIRTDIANYHLPDALDCPEESTLRLADIDTRLKRISAELQDKLINWGYAVCDAALRKHYDHMIAAPSGFPYPGGVR